MARRYFEFLGIGAWLRRWVKANQELAHRAGLLSMSARARGAAQGENSKASLRSAAGSPDASARRRPGHARRGSPRALGGTTRGVPGVIPELELKKAGARLDRFCDRVPAHVRDKLSYVWKVRGRQITLLERRPAWRGKPGEFTEKAFARFEFQPTTHRWLLKWSDRNGRFHPYERLEPVRSFDRLVDEVEADPTGIFLG
jgi:hypothetical protein